MFIVSSFVFIVSIPFTTLVILPNKVYLSAPSVALPTAFIKYETFVEISFWVDFKVLKSEYVVFLNDSNVEFTLSNLPNTSVFHLNVLMALLNMGIYWMFSTELFKS